MATPPKAKISDSTRRILESTITKVDDTVLRKVLTTICKGNPEAAKVAGQMLLCLNEDVEIAPRHARCKNCHKTFAIDDNKEGDCEYHTGVKEDNLENPGRFLWSCCRLRGCRLSGCKISWHEPVVAGVTNTVRSNESERVFHPTNTLNRAPITRTPLTAKEVDELLTTPAPKRKIAEAGDEDEIPMPPSKRNRSSAQAAGGFSGKNPFELTILKNQRL